MGAVRGVSPLVGDESADPAPPPADPAGLAAAALALATVDPERAASASLHAESAARAARDWSSVSVAIRARGVAHFQLRRLDEAVTQLRSAVAAARRAGDRQLAGEANMSLGAALMVRGQPTRGLATVDQAIADLHGVQAARAHTQRSAMLQFLGRLDEAMAELRLALPVLRRDGDAEWEVRALSNRSSMHVERRQFGLAEADLVRTQDLCYHHGLTLAGAYARQNLGCVHMARGNVPAALDCFAAAEEQYRALGMDVGSLLVDRATALLTVRLLEEARESAAAAIAVFESQHRVIERPEALLILSTVALLQAENDVAAAAADQAATAFRRLGRVEWLPLARYARVQAQLASVDGDGASTVPSSRLRTVADQLEAAGWTVPSLEARVLAARTALAEGRRRTARRDLQQAARARRAGPADARSRAWLAEALLREAEGSRGGAKRALRAGLRILDEHRLSLGASELRAHVSVHRTALASVGLRLALEDHDAAAVHWWGERRRASADLLRPALPPSDPTLARLLEDLRGTMIEIAQTRGEGRQSPGLVARQVQLERAIRDFARRHPSAVAQTAPPPRLADLAADLGDLALVELVDAGRDLAAVTVVDGRARLHRLGSAEELRHALRHLPFALRRLVQPRGLRATDAAAAVVTRARDVFERRLMEPIAAVVGERSLLVAPTGWLQGLPWALLPSCRGRPVTVAPSVSLWRTARERPAPSRTSVAIIAGPLLPGALVEARAVAALYPGAVLLEGTAAVSARVGTALGGATMCHIAAHGTVRPDNPLFSSLLLHDGPFTVLDLEQIGGTPRHVVMAACESGVSKILPGQEILGLTAALLSRQTATVIAPVVTIDDALTAPLMVAYHCGLRAGHDPASALATAQLRHGSGDPRSAATAAAFICLGVGDQRSDGLVELTRPPAQAAASPR